ncbi:MAG: glycosyltransferase family 1 protein [Ilumatobacteraceae bacterium]|nr:glycosyltransferase family 1 protein [Ilumatobacteraceae bacterium]
MVDHHRGTGVPPDLVVFSHLRWNWVWQRPQHLISRIADGRRVWFVEEPVAGPVDEPVLRTEEAGGVTRLWAELPEHNPTASFDEQAVDAYLSLLPEALGSCDDRLAWLYTPLALPLARCVGPRALVYDVMDDLASFAGAPPALVAAQIEAVRSADVVFTGGRSLHESILRLRDDGVHQFASGVDIDHYRSARSSGAGPVGPRPLVAGYVGVIDERLDLALVADLADRLPDWEIHMVGPVMKIEPEDLPQRPNISYFGSREYRDLPAVMAGFDVALMPFALNEATRSISPTKTLEYLAAGLPVVSTRVPDVVAECVAAVDLQDDGASFAEACARVAHDDVARRDLQVAELLARRSWDGIAGRMAELIEPHLAPRPEVGVGAEVGAEAEADLRSVAS